MSTKESEIEMASSSSAPAPRANSSAGDAGGREDPPDRLLVGEWEVRPRRNLLRLGDEEVHIEPQLADLLVFLARRPGEVISKQELIEGVWRSRFVSDSALTRTVAQLRSALRDDVQDPRYIETIPKRGYRLIAPVAWDDDGEEAESTAPLARRSTWIAATVAAVALAAVFGFVLSRPDDEQASPRPADGRQRLAVLPLQDLSPDSEDYFADSMTEALITDLARIPSLRITSRQSVERYRGSDEPLPAIARTLGVEAVVRGSILRTPERVRIDVHLVDVASDSNLWTQSYERPLEDVLILQREIARNIAEQVRATLSHEADLRLARSETVDPRVHDLYLKGRYQLNHCAKEGPNGADRLFRQALEIEPDYAPAWAGIADYYKTLFLHNHITAQEFLPHAQRAARRALEIDDDLAEAHAALAAVSFYGNWDWEESEARFERAIRLKPSDAEIRQRYAFFLACLGLFDRALEQGHRALALDPLSPDPRTTLGWVYFNAGRYEEALSQLTPEVARLSHPARLYRAWALSLSGDHAAADELFAGIMGEKSTPDIPIIMATYGWNLARADRVEEAGKALHRLQESELAARDPYHEAILYAGMSDRDRALDALGRAYDVRSPNMIFLKVEPFFDPVRDDPRYAALLEQVGLAG